MTYIKIWNWKYYDPEAKVIKFEWTDKLIKVKDISDEALEENILFWKVVNWEMTYEEAFGDE